MNTRFSPSLNGSLHLGHLYMAWVNYTMAKMHGGRFILRFDDLAPRMCGEDTTLMPKWAAEAEAILRQAGLPPDKVTYVGSYSDLNLGFPEHIDSRNLWVRGPALEGCEDLGCSPLLVAARVRADIAEEIDVVIRGEELVPELQLYEFLNAHFGGQPRQLVYLPRLRVRANGELTTISKTFGNLQLRDLFQQKAPESWLQRVQKTVLLNPSRPLDWANINPDPVIAI